MNSPKNINILLINPWISDFKAFDLWLKPLGLLQIGAILQKNGYRLSFIDCLDRNHPSVIENKKIRKNMTGKFYHRFVEPPVPLKEIPRRYKFYGIPEEAFRGDLEKIPCPHVILVTSTMTYWYPGVHRAVEILREKFPRVPVILGGIYATLCEDFARFNSGADSVFAGRNMADLLGLIGNSTDSAPHFSPENFSAFPHPAWNLYRRLDYGVILTSVGCPCRCTYCASSILTPRFITREPEKVWEEIFHLSQSRGIRHFAFYDDALLMEKERTVDLLERIARENREERPFSLHCPNGLHGKFIDEDMALLMREANFEEVRISLETSDAETQKATGGKVTSRDVERAVENLLAAGFSPNQIGIYTLMGIPGQTFHEVEKTIDEIHRLGVQNRLSFFSPVPGTADFKKIATKFPAIAEEPLRQNGAYQFYKGDWLTFEERNYLKEKTHRLNGGRY